MVEVEPFQPTRSRFSRRQTRWVAVALLGVIGVAFGVRVYPAFPLVFPEPGEVRLLGIDAYYHFRHAEYAAESFPQLQRNDLGTHYPTGQRSEAAGMFDLMIAAIAVAIDAGDPQRLTVLQVAAWIPPVLGALSFAAVFFLVRPALGCAGALLACVLYLLSPSHALIRTTLGFADHHAAEVLLAVLSAIGLARCLRDRLSLRDPRGWWNALVGAVPMLIFLFTWVGAPLFLLVLAATAGLIVVGQIAMAAPSYAGAAVFRYALTLGLWAAISAAVWPDLWMLPRLLDRLLISCGLFAIGPLALEKICAVLTRRGARPAHVALGSIVLAACVIAAWLGLDPESGDYLDQVFGAKTLLIREHHVVSPQHFWIQFGPAGVAAIVSIPLVFAVAWRRRDPLQSLLALFGGLLLVLWVQTRDYGYLVPPFVAAMAASSVLMLLRASAGTRLRVPVTVALVALLAFPVWPADGIRRPYRVTSQIAAVRVIHDGWWESMRWLRANARPLPFALAEPPPRFHRQHPYRYPSGSYGVLSGWEYGGFISAIARRPAMWSRGSNNDPTTRWLLGEVGVASFDTVASMCARCDSYDDIRYVVVDAETGSNSLGAKARQVGHTLSDYFWRDGAIRLGDRDVSHWAYSPAFHETMFATLYLHDGRGIGRLRLIYESAHQAGTVSIARPNGHGSESFEYRRRAYPIDTAPDRWRFAAAVGRGRSMPTTGRRFAFDAEIHSSVKIFERVTGARLIATAPSDAAFATARLVLRARTTGRQFEYETRVPIANGRFELVVPYPTSRGFEATEIVAQGPYRVSVDARHGDPIQWTVEVSARQVEQGAELELVR